MDPYCSYESTPHQKGVEESLTIVDGELKIILESEEVDLLTGETLVFSGNQTHRYLNTSETMTIIHLIIHYQYV
jgi:mannose-6-phosphate isomerase-like protein (cupin superfamily)